MGRGGTGSGHPAAGDGTGGGGGGEPGQERWGGAGRGLEADGRGGVGGGAVGGGARAEVGRGGSGGGAMGGAGRGLEVDGGAGRGWRWKRARRGGAMARGGAGGWSEEHGGGRAGAAATPRDPMGWAWGFRRSCRPRSGRRAECGRAPLGGAVPAVGLCAGRLACVSRGAGLLLADVGACPLGGRTAPAVRAARVAFRRRRGGGDRKVEDVPLSCRGKAP